MSSLLLQGLIATISQGPAYIEEATVLKDISEHPLSWRVCCTTPFWTGLDDSQLDFNAQSRSFPQNSILTKLSISHMHWPPTHLHDPVQGQTPPKKQDAVLRSEAQNP